ncbi:MAG: pseudaminic acid biosynthesis-associated methylase [Candidatus Moranbacteria bacterium]|nr:pseudaminic acid biosynthesis-associated methylase [Candidatus Moranbacteria bacterium]
MFKTDQEKFWAGEFGDKYIGRNNDLQMLSSSTVLFSKILKRTSQIKSILEFGANIGVNLAALRRLLPNAETSGVEINKEAVKGLKKNVKKGKVYHQSILDFKVDYQRDLVFTKGVLIHLNPTTLPDVYKKMYKASKRYILVAEYYNPTPIEISYRGNEGFLFKRDFAGELLETFKDLKLVDYGFAYRRDNNFPDDDISWFLLEKK